MCVDRRTDRLEGEVDVACLVLGKAREPKQQWHCPLLCPPSRGGHPEPAPQDPDGGSELREPQKEHEGSPRMAQGGEELFPLEGRALL